MTEVTLEWYEVAIAQLVGVARREESKKRGLTPTRRMNKSHEENLAIDIEAAAAEMAVAKALNRYWPGSVNAPKGEADVGHNIQVRHTALERGCLLVLPTDRDDQWFFLAVGQMPHFRIAGGILGRDAKRDEYLRNPHDRGKAYFVPQIALLYATQASLNMLRSA